VTTKTVGAHLDPPRLDLAGTRAREQLGERLAGGVAQR
jgi:hypothetical protein